MAFYGPCLQTNSKDNFFTFKNVMSIIAGEQNFFNINSKKNLFLRYSIKQEHNDLVYYIEYPRELVKLWLCGTSRQAL